MKYSKIQKCAAIFRDKLAAAPVRVEIHDETAESTLQGMLEQLAPIEDYYLTQQVDQGIMNQFSALIKTIEAARWRGAGNEFAR